MRCLYSKGRNCSRQIRSGISIRSTSNASCGKSLIELYEWGWIKKIPRIAVVNSEGANTFYELVNGLFENKELRWNNGKPDLEMIERYYKYKDKIGTRPRTLATAIQIGKPAN